MNYLRQALDETSASYQSCVGQLASVRDKVGTGELSLKEEYGQVRSIAEKRLKAFSESACRQNFGEPQGLAGEAASGLRLTGGEGGQRTAGSREGGQDVGGEVGRKSGQDELPGGRDEVRRDRRPRGGKGSKVEGDRRKRRCGHESHQGYNFQIGISTEAADSWNLGKVGKLGVNPDGGAAIFCSCGICIKMASECECDCATCVSGWIFREQGLLLTPNEFEVHVGKGHMKNWKKSLYIGAERVFEWASKTERDDMQRRLRSNFCKLKGIV
ncbi:hypothetical protein KFL_006390060 [Klebsormidium nitens]|uniref:SAND domain-containing protein n=1 Tax=Klebsormidium nitens TaxID=105231 RepID=A0A1Y1IMR7_KLENI|nr:hypothetical protein KFL_006390060 [Klebsormidium nitens]|eukprot:GAQ90441.1 hypothetical protein KFL_006390060 [Klebsormidium nitens]